MKVNYQKFLSQLDFFQYLTVLGLCDFFMTSVKKFLFLLSENDTYAGQVGRPIHFESHTVWSHKLDLPSSLDILQDH